MKLCFNLASMLTLLITFIPAVNAEDGVLSSQKDIIDMCRNGFTGKIKEDIAYLFTNYNQRHGGTLEEKLWILPVSDIQKVDIKKTFNELTKRNYFINTPPNRTRQYNADKAWGNWKLNKSSPPVDDPYNDDKVFTKDGSIADVSMMSSITLYYFCDFNQMKFTVISVFYHLYATGEKGIRHRLNAIAFAEDKFSIIELQKQSPKF